MTAKAAIQLLRDLSDGLKSDKAQMADLNIEIARDQKELFDSKGASGASGGWKPRKPSRRRNPLMYKTGRLYRACSNPNSNERHIRVENGSLTIKIAVPYAGVHQSGSRFTVARPIFDPTNNQLDRYAEVYISGVMGEGV